MLARNAEARMALSNCIPVIRLQNENSPETSGLPFASN